MTVPSNWYENFFHGIALDLWRKAVSPEQTNAEADFLVKTLECAPGSRLLDVPCGNGRHSLELAKRGYQMTGLDISEQFIEEARASSSEAQIEWVLGDMRHVVGEATFDGAFCVGNSFGYFEYSDMEAFLNGVARALKPGARFVVGTGTAAESILLNLKERTWYQIEDILFAIENRYQVEESCLDTNHTFVRDGKVETRQSKHWIYTLGEIRRMLERAGFAVREIYGSLDCEPYKLGSQQLFVVAQKQK
jgi:cyclopropane fatty-acyl-phospholipid synthase-like methyltransferase